MADLSERFIGHHNSGLYDAHSMLAACASQDQQMSQKMLESMKQSLA